MFLELTLVNGALVVKQSLNSDCQCAKRLISCLNGRSKSRIHLVVEPMESRLAWVSMSVRAGLTSNKPRLT
jgi:hypothetical protein